MNWKIAASAACIISASVAAAYAFNPSVSGRSDAGSSAQALIQAAATAPAHAAAPAAPVLVELFTSQGCSSCPPADVVLSRLQAEPNIVAISRPVTYWDRLGWRDTLGRQANTDLQHAYADRGVGGGASYTPEAVVNGKDGLVGSQEANLRRAIANARTLPAHRLTAADGTVRTAASVDGAAELRFVAIANMRSVRIGGGENGGRTVRYHNVVLNEASVGCAAGAACSATVPATIAATAGKDRVAAILQRPNGGEVLAVSWL